MKHILFPAAGFEYEQCDFRRTRATAVEQPRAAEVLIVTKYVVIDRDEIKTFEPSTKSESIMHIIKYHIAKRDNRLREFAA